MIRLALLEGLIQTTCAVGGLILLWCYASDTNRMKHEMLAQGSASRRPFFEIREGIRVGAFAEVELCNVGPGIALQTTWQLVAELGKEAEFIKKLGIKELAVNQLGAVGVGMKVNLPFQDSTMVLPTSMIDSRGILIHYEDTAGTQYWSTIKRNHEGYFVIDTGDARRSVGIFHRLSFKYLCARLR